MWNTPIFRGQVDKENPAKENEEKSVKSKKNQEKVVCRKLSEESVFRRMELLTCQIRRELKIGSWIWKYERLWWYCQDQFLWLGKGERRGGETERWRV